MKTSLNDTQTMEQYLEGKLSQWNRMLFAARLKMNPDLRSDLEFQKKTYWLLKIYHRKKLRDELDSLSRQLFSDPGKKDFQKGIRQIFGGNQ
jgi:hypothetical protein